jgi:enediyne polyketide synthase
LKEKLIMRKRTAAILDYACIAPGAHSPDKLWENILKRKRLFRIMPNERLPENLYYNPVPANPGTSYNRLMANITDWAFDPLKYKIPPLVAKQYDISHWLALDTAHKLLEPNNFSKDLDNERTGVIIGNSLTGEFSRSHYIKFRWPTIKERLIKSITNLNFSKKDELLLVENFEKNLIGSIPEINEDSLAGGMSNVIAGRIANYFNFKGGAFTIDGACSSSLLSIITACQAIESGQIDFAITGGVDVSLDPFEFVGFAKTSAFTKNIIRPYDKNADGMLPGEGCALLLIGDYETAIKAGHIPKAIIKGYAFSSDGAGEGITAPQTEGQSIGIRKTYEKAGYSIDTVDYFEGHGTGTAKGDRVEVSALINEIRKGNRKDPAYIGSLKANIGHTKAAAGAFGLLKAVMAIENRFIPPTTGCLIPNDAFENPPKLLMPSFKGQAWGKPEKHNRRASVSAMGFGGSNAHITIEDVSIDSKKKPFNIKNIPDHSSKLIIISAKTKNALKEKIVELNKLSRKVDCSQLENLSNTEIIGGKKKWRASFVVEHPGELETQSSLVIQSLKKKSFFDRSFSAGFSETDLSSTGKALIMFPGQGSQYYGMAAPLLEAYPELIEYADKLNNSIKEIISEGILHLISEHSWKKSNEELSNLQKKLTQTKYAQPAIVLTSLLIVKLLKKYSLKNIIATGHSLGEISALCFSGLISDLDAVKIAAIRGKLMSENVGKTGTMAAVFAQSKLIKKILAENKCDVIIANYNSDAQSVISGTTSEIKNTINIFKKLNIKCSELNVSHAFHSPIVAKISDKFIQKLSTFKFNNKPFSIIYSTVTGNIFPNSIKIDDYLGEQIKAPVNFSDTIENIFKKNSIKTVVECGPKNTLTNLLSYIPLSSGIRPYSLLVPNISPGKSITSALSSLYLEGCANILSDKKAELNHSACDNIFITNPLEEEVTSSQKENIEETATITQLDPYVFAVDWIANKTGFNKKDITLNMRFKEDLNLDSLKMAELFFSFGKIFKPGEIIGNPSIFGNATIKQLVDAFKIDNKNRFDQMKLRTHKKASIIHQDKIPVWTKIFKMELVEEPLKKEFSDNSTESIAVLGKYCEFSSCLRNVFVKTFFIENIFSHDFKNEKRIICFLPYNQNSNLNNLPDYEKQTSEYIFSVCKYILKSKKTFMEKFSLTFVSFYNGDLKMGVHPGSSFLKSLNLEYSGGKFKWLSFPENIGITSAAILIKNEIESKDNKVLAIYDKNLRRYCWLATESDLVEQKSFMKSNKKNVVLVTGGAKGVTFKLAFELARSIRCTLAIVGSTSLGETEKNKEVQNNFKKLQENNIEFCYYSCDLSSKNEVAETIPKIENHLGQISGILHGSGISKYNLFKDMNKDDYDKCLDIKVRGLLSILAICNMKKMRFIHLISSILAKTGMRMQADYCYANGWLDTVGQMINREHPLIQVITLGYTIWDGTGMGERDNVIGYLKSVGVVPISISEGKEYYKKLFSSTKNISTTAIAGRLSSDLEANLYPEIQTPELRFCERVLRHIPFTEIITQNSLSLKKDLYLKDHIYEGTVLMPLVMSLEALVQNATEITKFKHLLKIENIIVHKPIIITEDKDLELRIICISENEAPCKIRGVIKSENDDFQEDIVSADIIFSNDFYSSDTVVFKDKIPQKGIDATRFYPEPLFQGPIFRHLTKVCKLIENEVCVTEWEKGEERKFFSEDLPQKTFTYPSLIDSMMQTLLIMSGKIALPVFISNISYSTNEMAENGFIFANKNATALYGHNMKKLLSFGIVKTEKPD